MGSFIPWLLYPSEWTSSSHWKGGWLHSTANLDTLSGSKALFLSCVDPNLATVMTTLSWLHKYLKTIQNYLCLSPQHFPKSTPPWSHLFILILPLKVLAETDRGISTKCCVPHFCSIVSRQLPDMQFGAVWLDVRNNTQPHTALWISEAPSAFDFPLTHDTKLFFFLRASVYHHSSSLVRQQIQEICLSLWGCLRSKHSSPSCMRSQTNTS